MKSPRMKEVEEDGSREGSKFEGRESEDEERMGGGICLER